MPTEITLVRTMDGSLRPATPADQELVGKWKRGHAMRVQATAIKPRSLKHHQMYWAGLLALAMDYWDPKGGLISSTEKQTLKRFADWLDRQGGNTGAIRRACRAFLVSLRESRGKSIETPEKSIQALHEWVKLEAGYYQLEITPTGIRKVPVSINFNAMDQDEFNEFYKAAFSVVWRFILSRTFDSEEQANNAINQLLSLG